MRERVCMIQISSSKLWTAIYPLSLQVFTRENNEKKKNHCLHNPLNEILLNLLYFSLWHFQNFSISEYSLFFYLPGESVANIHENVVFKWSRHNLYRLVSVSLLVLCKISAAWLCYLYSSDHFGHFFQSKKLEETPCAFLTIFQNIFYLAARFWFICKWKSWDLHLWMPALWHTVA